VVRNKGGNVVAVAGKDPFCVPPEFGFVGEELLVKAREYESERVALGVALARYRFSGRRRGRRAARGQNRRFGAAQ
jgi:hypothetical protein